ncbi:MAG: sulfotransferase [Planctomycetes bacterium]|nr:sulfotransferase [Planctomycetota bacterium]
MKQDGDPYATAREVACPEITADLRSWIAEVSPNPGLFVFGVMPRSGSQFVTNLLALHPHLRRHPRDIWEIPLLTQSASMHRMTEAFFERYHFNRERLGDSGLCALLGTAFAAYLQAAAPGQRILMTQPSTDYLDHFFAYFPQEHLLLLMRDGRDVVSSVVKTWPQWDFSAAAKDWANNAQMMLRTRDLLLSQQRPVHYCTYEAATADSEAFVRGVCLALQLDPEVYPFEKIATNVLVKGSSEFEGSNADRWKADAKPAHFKPVGRWLAWSAEQKAIFKDIAGETLIACGYESSSDW